MPETIRIADLDQASQDCFTHFEVEAAGLLNNYSISLEDALIEQVKRNAQLQEEVKRLRALEEHNINY